MAIDPQRSGLAESKADIRVALPYIHDPGDPARAKMGRSSDGLEPRRRRILFQAWHRGTKEMDLVLGRFVDAYLSELTDTELGELEELMDYPDPDLFSWITGQEKVPAEVDSTMLRRLVAFHLGRS